MTRKNYILALESLNGDESTIYLEADGVSTDSLFCIVSVGSDGASIVDNGYRSLSEVRAAWPDAIVPRPANLSASAAAASFTIDAQPNARLAAEPRRTWKR
jgi:hypothetical protein